jgi:hypothetical protein
VHELGHNVLGRYCNDPEPIEETCFGYPSRIYNDNMAHFNQANTPADLNDVDLDDVDDQYVHFSGDVMCGAGFACDIPPGSEYDYGAATWVAVQLWRSFPP